jgi:sialic acid synthase SpsE
MPEKQFTIGGRWIGGDAPCFVIAEVGINHGGSEELCAAMIDAAAEAGADAVKLQTVTPEESYHPDTESYRIFSKATLPTAAYGRLSERANSRGVVLFSTPGDPTALRELVALGAPAIKISSGLLTNLPLIEKSAATGKPLIISTGMARAEEVEDAVKVARASGCRDMALLQCTSLYPAPAASLNLRAMQALEAIGGCPVGYSDHHAGHLAVVAAVARGAKLIEKHFTLDTKLPGADHAISVDPAEFAVMVRALRDVEAMLGSAKKQPVIEEEPLRSGRHRRLVAARDLSAGTVLSESDIFLMRLPGDREALPARDLNRVLGRKMLKPAAKLVGLTDDLIEGLR